MIVSFDNKTAEFKPVPLYKLWANMEELVQKGLTKGIGVSNCTIPVLVDLLSYAKIKPVVNQVECHPYFTRSEFLKVH